MTKVTKEQLGFRTGIIDETGVAWLEIYVKAKLAGECEEQRHMKKKKKATTRFNKADLSGNFMF